MATRPRRIKAKTLVMFARWTAKLDDVVDVIEIRIDLRKPVQRCFLKTH